MDSSRSWVKIELNSRGYDLDKTSKCGEFFRAKALYSHGFRYLYFKITECGLCGEDYLKPKWSKSLSHRSCSLDKHNNKGIWADQ